MISCEYLRKFRIDFQISLTYFFRTKLGVTVAQVEDQKAYIKQLVSTEADAALIQQERLVEQQLRKRQVHVHHGNIPVQK